MNFVGNNKYVAKDYVPPKKFFTKHLVTDNDKIRAK